MTDLERARERFDSAKRRFTEAAKATLDGEPTASQFVADALMEMNEARAALRALERE
jgi:hypothetical protein